MGEHMGDKTTPRGDDVDKNKLLAAILTNALFTAKLVHMQKGSTTDSKGIMEDVFHTWTAISQHFHNETTSQRKAKNQRKSDLKKM
jgi:hypothetical protein